MAAYIIGPNPFFGGRIINIKNYSVLAWTLFALIAWVIIFVLTIDLADRPVNDNVLIVVSDLLDGIFAVEIVFLAALIAARQSRYVISCVEPERVSLFFRGDNL